MALTHVKAKAVHSMEYDDDSSQRPGGVNLAVDELTDGPKWVFEQVTVRRTFVCHTATSDPRAVPRDG